MPLLLLMLWFLCLMQMTFAGLKTASTFVEPYDFDKKHEVFCWNDKYIEINFERLSWRASRAVCVAKKGQLLTLPDTEIFEFMGAVLEVSGVGYTSLWVGGFFNQGATNTSDGKWYWDNPHGTIDVKQEDKYPMTTHPFWVDYFDMKARGSYCLALDRRNHQDALITGLPCRTTRPYICVYPESNITTTPTAPVTLDTKTKKFILYNARYTWEGALTHCLQRGYRLATLENPADWELIAQRMLRTRPIMESAWTSGKYEDQQWRWIHDEKPIELVDPSNFNSENPYENNPPWFRKYLMKEGCLLADRHLCSKNIVFIEAKCNRRKGFICEEPSKISRKDTGGFVKVEPSSEHLWISLQPLSWDLAMEKCMDCFSDGQLLRIKDDPSKQLVDIYTALTVTLGKDIRHIWVAGFLFGNDYYWATMKEISLETTPGEEFKITNKFNEQSQVNAHGYTGLIVTCQNFNETGSNEYQCLNMDRENQKHFFLYGLTCIFHQYFICQASNSDGPKCSSQMN